MKSLYEKQMAALLKKEGYGFQAEVRFAAPRRWRFDFVLEPMVTKIAIEINGGTYMRGGRHNFGKGYENDLEKLNMAQLLGWIVLQYTPNTLPNIIKDLKFLAKTNNAKIPHLNNTKL